MSDQRRVQLALDKRLSVYQPLIVTWVGTIGTTLGNIYPSSNHNIIFVTDGHGSVHKVLNQRVQVKYGYKVLVGEDPSYPGVEQVLSYVPGLYAPPGMPIGVVNHGWTHEFDNPDTIWVQSGQIMPWLVRPDAVDAFSVDIYPGIDRVGAVWIFSPLAIVSLGTHVPLAGALFVVVCLHDDGTFTTVEGPLRDTPEILTPADVPAETVGTIPKAIVRLFSGQTAIRMTRTYTDILDPRWANLGSAGTDAQTIRGNLVDPTLTPLDKQVLTWDTATSQYISSDPYQWGALAGSNPGTEDLSALCNGVDNHFATAATFAAGTLFVFLNGLLQNPADITEDVPGNGFTLGFIPITGDDLIVKYLTNVGIVASQGAPPAYAILANKMFS
jgi:hypothetical protein